MSDFKSVMKGGWHPKGKDGGKESWRGDFKGINQVAGWMGKGKSPGNSQQETHISRPLASLKDPSSFGPPPKNVNYHGGAALPDEITPHRGGLGAPLTQAEISSAREATTASTAQEQAEQPQKAPPPPLPYRADRTGLKTDYLPPPTHKDLQATSMSPQSTSLPTPNVPPRLPSRQNTTTPPPPPPYEATTSSHPPAASTPATTLNQSAINRLGKAGVSVPGFGIGKSNNSNAEKNQTSSPSLSEIQSRFSKLNTSSTNTNTANANATTSPTATTPTAGPQTPSQPPSWQQTRSALTTANSAYKDPSSVSLADAQSAAATAQNAQRSAQAFRERHSGTINAAQKRATQLDQKYGFTRRANTFLENANTAHDKQIEEAARQATEHQATQQQQQPIMQSPPLPQHPQAANRQLTPALGPVSSPPPLQSAMPEMTASISRKPPPPPPPKKPASMQAPPPVPLGTKPNFG